MLHVHETPEFLKNKSKTWNKEIFGDLRREKNSLREKIDLIDSKELKASIG